MDKEDYVLFELSIFSKIINIKKRTRKKKTKSWPKIKDVLKKKRFFF